MLWSQPSQSAPIKSQSGGTNARAAAGIDSPPIKTRSLSGFSPFNRDFCELSQKSTLQTPKAAPKSGIFAPFGRENSQVRQAARRRRKSTNGTNHTNEEGRSEEEIEI
jgi:hypothetical protein